MKPIRNLLILSGLLFSIQTFAQNEFPNTIHYKKVFDSPEADLNDISWLTGYWKGEALGGIIEEVWSAPLAGSMMCAFKLVVEDSVDFYEIMTITEENNSIMLRLRHFYPGLVAWEEKDKALDFELVKVEEGKVFFNGLTFERISEDEYNVYVIFDTDGELSEMKFTYKRVKP